MIFNVQRKRNSEQTKGNVIYHYFFMACFAIDNLISKDHSTAQPPSARRPLPTQGGPRSWKPTVIFSSKITPFCCWTKIADKASLSRENHSSVDPSPSVGPPILSANHSILVTTKPLPPLVCGYSPLEGFLCVLLTWQYRSSNNEEGPPVTVSGVALWLKRLCHVY